jgi:hypothetical protein
MARATARSGPACAMPASTPRPGGSAAVKGGEKLYRRGGEKVYRMVGV